MPDEMSGGDLDGDEFVVIWNELLVAAFPSASLPAWSESEQQRLVPSEGRRRAQATPSSLDGREHAAAYHMLRTRSQLSCVGRFANQWLLVAETYGAADSRAVGLAYRYMTALDAGKMGGSASSSLPEEVHLQAYPRHLQTHFPKKEKARFSNSVDTALARLHDFEVAGAMPDCEPPDMWKLVHPNYKYPDGPQYNTVMAPILQKWEALYLEYRQACTTRMSAETSWDDPEKKRVWWDLLEEYRDKFLADHLPTELKWCAASPHATPPSAVQHVLAGDGRTQREHVYCVAGRMTIRPFLRRRRPSTW